MIHAAYYISAYDLSHAVRSCAVIEACSQINPFLFFHIRTSAPHWLFELLLRSNYFYYDTIVDPVPHDSRFDMKHVSNTLPQLHNYYSVEKHSLDQEIKFLQENNIELVISDISSIAFTAASRLGIPSVGIGHFSWDEIYKKLARDNAAFSQYIRRIEKANQEADFLFRLPFHWKMAAFSNVHEMPLIGRKARRRARDIRKFLGIAPEDNLVFIAMHPADQDRLELQHLACFHDYKFIVPGTKKEYDHVVSVAVDMLPFEELVHAADFVVAMPEYHIVIDCITHRKPLIFTNRSDFPEEKNLVAGLYKYGNCVLLQEDDFFGGNWKEAFEFLAASPVPEDELDVEGAQFAAKKIDQLLRASQCQSSRRKVSAASPRNE